MPDRARPCSQFQQRAGSAAAKIEEPSPNLDNGSAASGRSVEALFGPSSAKRPRANGPDSGRSSPANPSQLLAGLPEATAAGGGPGGIMVAKWAGNFGRSGNSSGNNSESENNNKAPTPSMPPLPHHPHGESLLSQALEKHPAIMRTGLGDFGLGSNDGSGGAGSRLDDSASDTASDKPESILDGLKSAPDAEALHRHLTASSPAAAAAAAAAATNPLFPPGLEALYRQAGFPSAFLGLAAGAAGASAAASVTASAAGSSSSAPSRPDPPPSIPGMSPSGVHGGLQSHANNPNREYK